MVAHGAPANGVAEGGLIHFKEAVAEFLVGAGAIGHVTNVEVEVDGAAGLGGVGDHGVVDLGLGFAAGAGIADDPKENGSVGAGDGVGFEAVGLVGGSQTGLAIVNRVVVGAVWFQLGESGFILTGVDGSILVDGIVSAKGGVKAGEDLAARDLEGEFADGFSVNNPGFDFLIGSPDDPDGIVGGHLNIGLTGKVGNGFGCREQGGDEEK